MTDEKKANAFMAGQCKVEVDEDTMETFDNLLIIQCQSPEQIREAVKSGKLEFTVFGE